MQKETTARLARRHVSAGIDGIAQTAGRGRTPRSPKPRASGPGINRPVPDIHAGPPAQPNRPAVRDPKFQLLRADVEGCSPAPVQVVIVFRKHWFSLNEPLPRIARWQFRWKEIKRQSR